LSFRLDDFRALDPHLDSQFCVHGWPVHVEPCPTCRAGVSLAVLRKRVVGWSAKQKRAFRRLLSGLRVGRYCHDDIRFLTLTSSPESGDLTKDFAVLVKRIRRKFGKFQYCKIRTVEGFGVLHLLYRGCFLPVEWLRKQWFAIHRAFEIWIKPVYSSGIAQYMVTQYMSNQLLFLRGSSSRLWIFRGAPKVWRYLIRKCFELPKPSLDFEGAVRIWKDACLFDVMLFGDG
jgi:hypothetical protein